MKNNNHQWVGIFKLIEECNELGTIAAKLCAYPNACHPDGKGDLIARLKDEMADVMAIIQWFEHTHDLNVDLKRIEYKFNLFEKWNQGIDGYMQGLQG